MIDPTRSPSGVGISSRRHSIDGANAISIATSWGDGGAPLPSGTFDRHPELTIITVHTGGAVPARVGHLGFGWRLNFNGVVDRSEVAAWEDRNELSPSDYPHPTRWGLSASCVRHAIEL